MSTAIITVNKFYNPSIKLEDFIDLHFSNFNISLYPLKLNKYEVVSNYHIVTLEQYTDSGDNNQIEQTMLNLEQESNNNMSSCESDTHSDQSDDETTSKV
jgi:hypothetical protein